MNAAAALFYEIGEPYAAGLFEEPEKSFFYRHALANARYFEALPPAKYEVGELLYPMGTKYFRTDCAVKPQFAMTYSIDWKLLEQKSAEAAEILRPFADISHGYGGWTHSCPNYNRIIREGLSSYRERLLAQPESEFRSGLLALLDGMQNYLHRSVEYLRQAGAPEMLINAVERMPFAPAESYYEGLVAWNLAFYFDGADNLGCLDKGLAHLYAGEDLTHIINQMFSNIDAIGTWSCTVGPEYNAITEQALRAVQRRRRPMVELMVTENMPDHLWEIAVENIRNGCTNPSFYNTNGIYSMLKSRFPYIPDEDIRTFCGCGCTETTLQGLTRAGGCDHDFPTLAVFEEYMHAQLTNAETFEEFYEGFCCEAERRLDEILDRIVSRYENEALYLPNPVRTLLTDDCIDKQKDFNAGGARYTWTQSSQSGFINTIDSLLAVRELVFRKKVYTQQEFLEKLTAEDDELFAMLKHCPCYGVDDDDADDLAVDLANRIYMCFPKKPTPDFVDGCILTEHQFTRYFEYGLSIGPTPDGRKGGSPTCDSIGCLRGKAVKGPTAMLRSAAKLPQHLVEGISVLNLTISKQFAAKSLRALVEAYFAMGGIQVQVTCTSVEELKDALEHPDQHKDLIVRVGGFSDYFVNIHPALQRAIVERDIHALQ